MMRLQSLLMLSTVVSLTTANVVQKKNVAVADSVTDAEGKVEMQAVLKLEFAEPLPTVIARAQKASKTMDVTEAMQIVGSKMSGEIQGLLQGRNVSQNEVRLRANRQSSGATMSTDSRIFDKAMGFINDEYVKVREELDLELLACGFYKLEKEALLYATQDKLDELAMDMGLAEATMGACTAEIAKQNDFIEVKEEELDKLTRACQARREELEAIKAAAEDDYRVITLILETTQADCAKPSLLQSGFQIHACLNPDGKTHFETNNALMQKQVSQLKSMSNQQAFQQALYSLYGEDTTLPGALNLQALGAFDDDDASDDFPADLMQVSPPASLVQVSKRGHEGPAPDAGTSNKASNDAMRERCSGITKKPHCGSILDKIGPMVGECKAALDVATQDLQQHNTECEIEIGIINEDIATAKGIIAVQTEEFNKASAFHNGMAIEHGHELAFKLDLCKELRIEYTKCYKKCKDLEREMCGLLKVRQAVYNKIKNPDKKKPEMLIQDCFMTDWVVGPCSGTCLSASGASGMQLITREPQVAWDNTTEEGKYGARCPPDQAERDCATEQCPIDCAMKDWSLWSECTAPCGGGSESRTRGILHPDEHGGLVCPANGESASCNTQSCDADCVLSDWGAWSPCTKSCRAKYSWEPGMQTRTKEIASPTVGAGKCWAPKTPERWEQQNCNTFMCPKNIECVANMDVVFVQDGSGSLWYPWRGKKYWDRNFELAKSFMLKMIEKSKMATVDENDNVGDGARFGVVTYSFNPKVVTQIQHDAKVLETKIKAMKWPMGGTMTGKALLEAKKLFIANGSAKRIQVMVLITDGRASNRMWAKQGAKMVRDSGIRLMVIPVKNAVRSKAEMCGWASRPCKQNMIMTPAWTMLVSKLKMYLTSICPTVAVPGIEF